MNTQLDMSYAAKRIATSWNYLTAKHNDYNTQKFHGWGINNVCSYKKDVNMHINKNCI